MPSDLDTIAGVALTDTACLDMRKEYATRVRSGLKLLC